MTLKTFDFGSNWQEFSRQRIDVDRTMIACESLRSLSGKKTLAGMSFLDVGCGSGLFSIAAHQLGATRVVGIDLNPRCIEISKENRDRLAPRSMIEFCIASALETATLEHFGVFDLVYAWGSLHHTGSMWTAIRNVARCVAPGGMLIVAIYNKHITSPSWKFIKWFYNQVPRLVQRLMIVFFAGIIWIAKFLVTRRNPLKKERGMDFWFDVIDWVGGYPYQYATYREVESFVTNQGFEMRRYISATVPTGCNQFVFDRKSATTNQNNFQS
jgi:ubiquinone/menaquinone biosynthesis C-methylase UbiE